MAKVQVSRENLCAENAPARCRGSSSPERSVAGRYWCPVTAEAVVDAQGDHIHILADPVVEETDKTQIGSRERIIRVAHKQVIVFNTGGPIRCEAILPSNTHGATPAGRACRGQFNAGKVIEDAKAVARHCRAALEVKQRGVPCITDLAGEKADAIGFGASRERRIEEADSLVAEIRPIALGFQAKHPLVGLPAITELAAEEASGSIAAALSDGYASRVKEIHTAVALSPPAIGPDVKAGPIVDRR